MRTHPNLHVVNNGTLGQHRQSVQFIAFCYLLPISCCLLPTAYNVYCLLPIAWRLRLLAIAHGLAHVAYGPWPEAYCIPVCMPETSTNKNQTDTQQIPEIVNNKK